MLKFETQKNHWKLKSWKSIHKLEWPGPGAQKDKLIIGNDPVLTEFYK